MAIPFLKGIDVTGTVDLSNLTVDGAQGTDGQVLTSTGSGIAWEDASGGASLSGGAANKLAIWSGTDALTNDTNLHWDTTNDRLGIGTATPGFTFDVVGQGNFSNYLNVGSSTGIKSTGWVHLHRYGSSTNVSVGNNGTNVNLYVPNGKIGIGTTTPNRPLVVSETRTDSTASDAYTAVVKSVQDSGLSTNPGTGGLKVQYTSSSSNVHAFGLVAGSSSSDFLTTGPMHFYTNSDLDTVSATGFAMQLDTSQRLILGSTTATQKLNVDGNVKANRYYGHSSTAYYVDPDDGTASAILNGAVSIGNSSVYTKFTVSTPAGYGDGADGIFIRSSFAGSSPVVSDKDPFLSIGCADSSSAVATIFMGEDGTATSQESKIEYSHDNATLGIFVTGQGSYREHVRFGNQSSGTARTRFYGNVGIGTDPSSALHVSGTARITEGITTDGNSKFYTWRALNNTSNSSNQYYRIARITASQSSRFIIELAGRSTSYTDGDLPAFGKIVGQLNNDNNYDIVYYNASATDEVVDEVGQVDVSTTATDIYVRVGQYAELTATAHISDGTIVTYDTNNGSTSAPTNYVQATEYKLWNTGNDGASSGLDADLLDGQEGSYYLNYNNFTNTPTLPTDFVSKANGGTFSGNVSIDQGTSGDAILTIRSDTDNNNEGDHPSIRLKQDGDLVDYRIGLGLTDGQVNTNDNEFCITNITSNSPTSFRFSPNNGTNSYLVYHDNYHPDADNADTVDNLHASQFLRSDANDTFTGKLAAGDTDIRRAGMYGIYDSYRIGHIWSMGTGYNIANNGADFGNLYGLAYKHTNNTTGGTMGGSHQMVWCNNGSPRGSIGYNSVWHAESMKAPIYYDANDTNYKVDPNGTSNLNHLNVAGTFRFQRSAYTQTSQDDNVTVTVGDSDITFTHNNDSDGDASQYNFKYTSGGSSVDILNFASNYANFTTPYVRCNNNSTDYAQLESNSSGGVLKAVSNGNTNVLFRSYGDSYTLNDLGVGTSSPGARLHVDHATTTTPTLTFGGAAGQILQSENSEFAFGLTAASPYPLYIQGRTSSNTARDINLQPVGGDIGIGVASPGFKLDVNGTIRATADVVAYSDIRVKENIKTIDNALNKVKNLRGVEYNRIDNTEKNIGVIAQEVEKILPEVVREDGEGMKSVAYGNITAILIEAIKEQQKQIDELKSIINGGS